MAKRKIVQLSIAGETTGGGHLVAAAVADDGSAWTMKVAADGASKGAWQQLPELPERSAGGVFDAFAEKK
jgi:hypothetical protein